MPNTDYYITEQKWQDTLECEFFYTRLYSQLHLLVSEIKEIKIRLLNGTVFSTYIAPSFQSLSEKGLYVIDHQNKEKSCWKFGENSFFSFNTGRPAFDNLEIWDDVIIPYIKDLGKAYAQCTHISKDTLNLCIQKINTHGSAAVYQARLFLFDFQNCRGREVVECSSQEEYEREKISRKNNYINLCKEYDQNPLQRRFEKYKNDMLHPLELVFAAEYDLPNKEAFSTRLIFIKAQIDRHFKVFLWKVIKTFTKPPENT